jgi:hypothetical protein
LLPSGQGKPVPYASLPGTAASGYVGEVQVGRLQDGRQVAVVPLSSGTLDDGTLAALVFAGSPGHLSYVSFIVANSYHMSLAVSRGAIETASDDGSPRCCPPLRRYRQFVVNDARLRLVRSWTRSCKREACPDL